MQMMQASNGERYVIIFVILEVVNALHLRVLRKEFSGSQVQASLISRGIFATGCCF
jgi:uncharacterized protein YfbU (UPF0304 family)